MTNTLFLDHLESRGWVSLKRGCQFPGCDHENDNLAHTIKEHAQLHSLSKQEIGLLVKAINAESKTASNGRFDLSLSPRIAAFLGKLFGNIKAPFLEAKRQAHDRIRRQRKSVATAAIARARQKVQHSKVRTTRKRKKGPAPRLTPPH